MFSLSSDYTDLHKTMPNSHTKENKQLLNCHRNIVPWTVCYLVIYLRAMRNFSVSNWPKFLKWLYILCDFFFAFQHRQSNSYERNVGSKRTSFAVTDYLTTSSRSRACVWLCGMQITGIMLPPTIPILKWWPRSKSRAFLLDKSELLFAIGCFALFQFN